MFGLMQDRPQLISSLIEHAARFHPEAEIVSRLPEGDMHRSNWREMAALSRRIASGLAALGVRSGDRIATMAWNSYRHLALYYGVSGSGAVLHTINPRLFPTQIEYIVNHAEDTVLFFDTGFADLVESLAPRWPSVRAYVALCSRDHMKSWKLPGLRCFDQWVAAQPDNRLWPEFDERSASSLCYTSGTTGNPKGVLYSHRSTVLHSLMALCADTYGVNAAETLLLVVPMFHANAWGTPCAAAMTGAKLVFPGPYLDGESVYNLLHQENVTYSQGVPAVWSMLFRYLDDHPGIDPAALAMRRVGIGGSAVPQDMLERFERQFNARVLQGWGMTETSPLGVVNTPLPKHAHLDEDSRMAVKRKQGRGMWGVELRIVDESDKPLPRDGVSAGRLRVRGPWIASDYFKDEGGDVCDPQGFFDTGDIASIDQDGYLRLIDRAKDVIKSGGEWISSIEMENVILTHAAVAEAAVIGVPHPKWQAATSADRAQAWIRGRPGVSARPSEGEGREVVAARWDSHLRGAPANTHGKIDEKQAAGTPWRRLIWASFIRSAATAAFPRAQSCGR